MSELLLHNLLAEAAKLRAAALDAHGIDAARLARLSREHLRLSAVTGRLAPADLGQYRLIVQQIEAEQPALRLALADLFAGPRGVVRVTGLAALNPAQQAAITEAADYLSGVTAMNVTVHAVAPPGQRREAYDPAACSLLLSHTGTPAAVVLHELGHAVEHQAASGRQIELRQAFYALRTNHQAPVPLQTVTGNPTYHPTEQTKTDTWVHPYIGKVYADRRASELLSMGLQLMYSDPVVLAGDLAYLDFLYVFLRSACE